MNYQAIGRAYWRPYELESCNKYFTPGGNDILFWRHNTENVNQNEYNECSRVARHHAHLRRGRRRGHDRFT